MRMAVVIMLRMELCEFMFGAGRVGDGFLTSLQDETLGQDCATAVKRRANQCNTPEGQRRIDYGLRCCEESDWPIR
jgi:hypothetical protein